MDQLIRLSNEWGGSFAYCVEHIDAHRPHLLGTITESTDVGECPDCRTRRHHETAPADMRAALLATDFSHTRVRSWCGVSIVYAYRRDASSPSGVFMAAGLDEPRFNILVDQLRQEGVRLHGGHAPLSPTEGR